MSIGNSNRCAVCLCEKEVLDGVSDGEVSPQMRHLSADASESIYELEMAHSKDSGTIKSLDANYSNERDLPRII